MSSDIPTDDTQESTEGAKVIDEENRVDKRLKDRILDARERVAEREDACFVEAPLRGDVDYSPSDLVQIWSTSVRQYLRTIEPLLRSDEISKSHHYYREVPILQDKLYPPDGETVVAIKQAGSEPETDTEHIRWSMFYDDDTHARDMVGDPSFEPPEPEPIELTGLKSIIETEVISHEWAVVMNPSSHFSEGKKIAYPKVSRPLSKRTLENAVRKADRFLQQAGIGLEIGDPTKEADADYSDIVDVDSLE